jgi:hypothetical protein
LKAIHSDTRCCFSYFVRLGSAQRVAHLFISLAFFLL